MVGACGCACHEYREWLDRGIWSIACMLISPFMLQNCFIVFLSVDLVKMSLEICVPGFWPVDIIGHTIGECGLIGAVFLAACRKKAEWISESLYIRA
jgi:hypothetical protein